MLLPDDLVQIQYEGLHIAIYNLKSVPYIPSDYLEPHNHVQVLSSLLVKLKHGALLRSQCRNTVRPWCWKVRIKGIQLGAECSVR